MTTPMDGSARGDRAGILVGALARHFSLRVPVRGIAVCIWAVVALNAGAWLSGILGPGGDGRRPSYPEPA